MKPDQHWRQTKQRIYQRSILGGNQTDGYIVLSAFCSMMKFTEGDADIADVAVGGKSNELIRKVRNYEQ